MTDDIKVGDRFLVPMEIVETLTPSNTMVAVSGSCRVKPIGRNETIWVDIDVIKTCTRLPPEIGVGDTVKHKYAMAAQGKIIGIDDDEAWVRLDAPWLGRRRQPINLSDLSLVKKAEKG